MTTYARSRLPNIANVKRNDKKGRHRWGWHEAIWSFLAPLLWLAAARASAMPVTIAWEVPLNRAETFVLEVAKDPGFGELVLTTEVKGTAYTWNVPGNVPGNAPGEGVYHWRLVRPSQRVSGDDASTFVSGSFAVIDPQLKREHPPKLSWAPVATADKYQLYLADEQGRQRLVETTAPFFLPPNQVVPYTGGHRTNRDFHYDPSLKLEAGLPPPPPRPLLLRRHPRKPRSQQLPLRSRPPHRASASISFMPSPLMSRRRSRRRSWRST